MRRHLPALLALLSHTVLADQLIIDAADPDPSSAKNILLPYAFNTEELATGVGAIYARSGGGQAQQSAFASGYYTTNDSYGVIGGLNRRRVWSERLYFSPIVVVRWNKDQRFYGDLFFRQADGGAGSNESDVDNFESGEGTDSVVDLPFRFVLPLGDGREASIRRYETRGGLPVLPAPGRRTWNPLNSGFTILEIKPFYQRRSLEITQDNVDQFPPLVGVVVGETATSKSAGVAVTLEYDNRDFPVNPARGSFTWARIERDWGWLASTDEWTSLQGSFSKYFDLESTKFFRQRVVALDAWTAYTPTWTVEPVGDGFVFIRDRPPGNRGASLGGPIRLRAYPLGRFNDKAAIYYSAELRLIPEWDPLARWPIVRRTPWRWWQWVLFGELGRVAKSWDVSTLHDDMKWSVGFGFRAMIGSSVARLDIAISDESTQGMLFLGQPF
ncbi:MAG: BamA/TamA family outer membrane protein [Gammaproteobacteria bacterium]